MNATEQIVQHIIQTRYEDLSTAAIAAAKTFFLDTLGVTVAGMDAPFAAGLRQAVSAWGSAAEANILGSTTKLPAAHAALINGFHAHCQEFDCVHEPAVVHPLASIQSALIAFCQREAKYSGKDLILALCLGVDVSTSIGVAAKTGLRFFRPATAGVFGTTVALAKLAGFSKNQLMDAMGLALAQSSGTMQAHVEGKPTLALLVGMAARNGILALDLARNGMAGPHDVLEGAFGYFPLLEGQWDLAPVLAELGQVWRITEVSHKPFPTGRANHGGIDGIQQLKASGVQAADIGHLQLLAPPLIDQLVGRPILPDMAVNYARLCFQFVGATALLNETVGIADFSEQCLRDPERQQLAQRIQVVIDDNPDPNALIPQKIIADLSDGSRREVLIEHTLGSPDNALSHAAHLAKFRRCWQHCSTSLATENGERLIEWVDHLEDQENLDELFALLQP